eukprot:4095944-Prymnesium_polylepis.1
MQSAREAISDYAHGMSGIEAAPPTSSPTIADWRAEEAEAWSRGVDGQRLQTSSGQGDEAW